MRVAIVGASGGLGLELVHQALAEGLKVHALTRDPRRLRITNDHLNVFEGDADTGRGLDNLVRGCRFFVSAMASKHPADAVGHMVQALAFQRVERVAFVSRLPHRAHGLRRLLVRREAVSSVEHDLDTALDVVRVSGLAYVVIHCSGLTEQRTDRPLAFVEGKATGAEPPPVSRQALARFILEKLEAPEWNCREVTVRPG